MVTSLGDQFPKSYREDFSVRSIRPGAVFRLHVTSTNPPKIKRIVVLAVSGEDVCVGYLFLNSEINSSVFHNAALRDLHIPFACEGREYLDHNSYLDCSSIQKINLDELQNELAWEPCLHIGNLVREELENIVEKVKNAPTISNNDKRMFNLI